MIAAKVITPEKWQELSAEQPESPKWLVKNLIEDGDQVLLIAAPKVGKTLLASQIASALASGSEFLGWEIPRAVRVLYINLEVRRRNFVERLTKQCVDFDQVKLGSNLFVACVQHSLNVLDPELIDEIENLVRTNEIELVVWDVLARLHDADEQSNNEMRKVMHAFRKASALKAHLIVHHTRKPPPSTHAGGSPVGAESIRGASAIHGEVDLAMILSRHGSGEFKLLFSARNVDAPDVLSLVRDPNTLLYACSEACGASQVKDAVEAAFLGVDELTAGALHTKLSAALGIRERQSITITGKCVKEGLLLKRKRGNNQMYSLARVSARSVEASVNIEQVH